MMTLSEKKKERAERKRELHLQTSSPPAMMNASAPADAHAQGGPNGPKSSLAAAKKQSATSHAAAVADAIVSNNGDAVYGGGGGGGEAAVQPAIESLEQVEALIKMKKLPAETVAIHSPESGTTLY